MPARVIACVDCGQEQAQKVCVDCLKNRVACARQGCAFRIKPNTKYTSCYNCACASKYCFNARESHSSYCVNCNREWDAVHVCKTQGCSNVQLPKSWYCKECCDSWSKVCHICQTAKANVGFNTCADCNAQKPQCALCSRKAMFDADSGEYISVCKQCKCKTCFNPKARDQSCCDECVAHYCTVCKSRFPRLGQTVCSSCQRL
jgi:hypothetical protein